MKKLLKKLSLLLGLTLLSYGAIDQGKTLAASFNLSFHENSQLVGTGTFSEGGSVSFPPPVPNLQYTPGIGFYFYSGSMHYAYDFSATLQGTSWVMANASGGLLWESNYGTPFSLTTDFSSPGPFPGPVVRLGPSWLFKNAVNGDSLFISGSSLGSTSLTYALLEGPGQFTKSRGYVTVSSIVSPPTDPATPIVSPPPSPNNSAIPEPTTILGLALAGGGLSLVRRSIASKTGS